MFTLIAIGVGAAYGLQRGRDARAGVFPSAFAADGRVGIYFEAAAVIVVLVLLGQVIELRARHKTGDALRALLDLAPENGTRRRRTARNGMCHSNRLRSAPTSACAREKKCRSMAPWSKAAPRSTNP